MFTPDAPRLKQRLTSGGGVGLFWFVLGSPALVEAAVRAGAEAVVIDMQHGLFDRRDLEAAVGACPPETPCLVRVEDDSDTAIARALDAGAEGIIVPMVETGAQAARAAGACRYPPDGRRSAGGVRPLIDFGSYRAGASAAVTVGVMIETAAGVDNAAAIVAAPGVDFVFIGPGDLGLSLGVTPEAPEALERAIEDVMAVCRLAGKPCGLFTFSAEAALRRRDEGFALTVIATDLILATEGFAAARRAWDLSHTSGHHA